MTKHHFSIQEVLSFGWAKTKQHAWFVALTFIIGSIVLGATGDFHVMNVVVALMTCLSVVSIALTISRDHSFSFYDLATPLLSHKKVLKFFALAFLLMIPVLFTFFAIVLMLTGTVERNSTAATLGVILTLPLLAITVFYSVRFKFFPFIVLEHENASLSDLIKMSYKLTAGHFLPLFVLLLVLSLLNLLGALFFCVGLLVTIPVSVFALAHVYNKLKEHSF